MATRLRGGGWPSTRLPTMPPLKGGGKEDPATSIHLAHSTGTMVRSRAPFHLPRRAGPSSTPKVLTHPPQHRVLAQLPALLLPCCHRPPTATADVCLGASASLRRCSWSQSLTSSANWCVSSPTICPTHVRAQHCVLAQLPALLLPCRHSPR